MQSIRRTWQWIDPGMCLGGLRLLLIVGVMSMSARAVAQLPDLFFRSASGNSLGLSCAEDQQMRRLHVCIGNRGEGPASTFTVALDNLPLWVVPWLGAGAAVCLSTPLYHSATLRIDPSEEVEESDEANNEHFEILPTQTRGPGCTPTPSPHEKDACCDLPSGCTAETDPTACYRQGGRGFAAPYLCQDDGRCRAPTMAPPLATVTPPLPAADLIAGPVFDGSYAVRGPECPSDLCMLVCVRNGGSAPSDSFDLTIGSYWRKSMTGLEPGEQSCVLATRAERGILTADAAGSVGEADEENNAYSFQFSAVPTQTPTSTLSVLPTVTPTLPGDLGERTVRGRVYDAVTGETSPVAAARVEYRQFSLVRPGAAGEVASDSEGYFGFTLFLRDTDTIQIRIVANGYLDAVVERSGLLLVYGPATVDIPLIRLPTPTSTFVIETPTASSSPSIAAGGNGGCEVNGAQPSGWWIGAGLMLVIGRINREPRRRTPHAGAQP